MQGWRQKMEDAHINEPTFTSTTSLFAVFDGHGGPEVAIFCERHFGEELKANKNFQNGVMEDALIENFLKMDELLKNPEGQSELNSLKAKQDQEDMNKKKDNADEDQQQQYEPTPGCTANVVLIYENIIYCANSGDSRCLLYSKKKVID